MSGGFIIVKRDDALHDEGVLTAAGSLVLSSREMWPGHPWVQFEPAISPHIEHAFVFPGPWQAYRWLDRILSAKGDSVATWVVRSDPEFYPGESKIIPIVPRPLGEPLLSSEGRARHADQQTGGDK